jgi:hypothetical protein
MSSPRLLRTATSTPRARMARANAAILADRRRREAE